jgi:hypothetical protein
MVTVIVGADASIQGATDDLRVEGVLGGRGDLAALRTLLFLIMVSTESKSQAGNRLLYDESHA